MVESTTQTVIAIALGVAIVIAVIYLSQRRVTRQQARLQGEMRELTRLKYKELQLLTGGQTGAAREPARDGAEQLVTLDAIRAEIEAGPYVRHHVHPDLPPEVGVLRWETPDGPIIVTGPRRIPLGARRRHGFHGLAAVPAALGALWRGAVTTTQAGAVAVTMAPTIPAPPALALGPPPAVRQPSHTRDTHVQVAPPLPIILPSEPRLTGRDQDRDEERVPEYEASSASSQSTSPASPRPAPVTPTMRVPAPSPDPSPAPPSTSPSPSPSPSLSPSTAPAADNELTAERTGTEPPA